MAQLREKHTREANYLIKDELMNLAVGVVAIGPALENLEGDI